MVKGVVSHRSLLCKRGQGSKSRLLLLLLHFPDLFQGKPAREPHRAKSRTVASQPENDCSIGAWHENEVAAKWARTFCITAQRIPLG